MSINQKLVELGVVRTVAKPILEEEVNELEEPLQLVLPEGNQWDVYITFVTSTNSIMLRLVGDEYSVCILWDIYIKIMFIAHCNVNKFYHVMAS